MTLLKNHLEAALARSGKLLAIYLMGGFPDEPRYAEALTELGELADVVEVGLPYSDPLMDGPVIAAAAERAIAQGTGPLTALDLAAGVSGSDRVAMTYYNPIHRVGAGAFCDRLVAGGFCGLIVPDLPLEESAGLRSEVAARDLAWIPLVAPSTTTERAKAICESATGFVYAVSTLGVTGARSQLSERAAEVVAKCRSATDAPVLVGIGVSTPDQAAEAAITADGVVMGSAVLECLARGLDDAKGLVRAVVGALRT